VLLSVRKYSTNTASPTKFDVGIVGGGIVGTATARELLLRYPHLKVVLLEKEEKLGLHQSSHNSGVIHSGLYYLPGSKRAKLCVTGSDLMYKYIKEPGIPFDRCGKVIVAVRSDELPRLDMLYKRGIENGVPDLRMLNSVELQNIEPFCKGLRAIHVPGTGITNYGKVVQALAEDAVSLGCEIICNFNATIFHHSSLGHTSGTLVKASSSGRSFFVNHLITCPGLYADRVARAAGGQSEPAIIPFRGDFLKLKPDHSHMVRGMIYPVPNPAFPFLGVHFTRRTNGEVWLGPNAVLGFAREGYNWATINVRDMLEAVKHQGLRKLAVKHFKFGLGELYRDIVPSAYLEHLTPYMPELTLNHVDTSAKPSGVRAQAIGSPFVTSVG
jgi:2-hydroxyglutarate dehydrogenase